MNHIKDPRFFRGGNATFTVSNDKGEHYTYKIRQSKDGHVYFVFLLTGPDNESSFTYLGIFEDKIRLTAKSKMLPQSKPVLVFDWAVKRISEGRALPPGYAVQHCGRCARCGRKLTVPESIDSGFGPECIQHINK